MAIMAAAAAAPKQLMMNSQTLHSNKPLVSISISAHYCHSLIFSSSLSFSKSNSQFNDRHSHNYDQNSKLVLLCFRKSSSVIALNGKDGGAFSVDNDNEEGISLGTMKLPLDTDIPRFELLLFQWANSLSQGAQLPLPVPLKVDKIEGGVRLGFVDIDDGKTEVRVYIDCQVISNDNNNSNSNSNSNSYSSEPPMFIATRNGALKNKVPLGEPRIIKSLLAALKKSIDIARL